MGLEVCRSLFNCTVFSLFLFFIFAAALGCSEQAIFWGHSSWFSVLPAGQACRTVVHLPSILILPSARSLHNCEESGKIQPPNSKPQGKNKYCACCLLGALASTGTGGSCHFLTSSQVCWFQAQPSLIGCVTLDLSFLTFTVAFLPGWYDSWSRQEGGIMTSFTYIVF